MNYRRHLPTLPQPRSPLPTPTVYRLAIGGRYNEILSHIQTYPQDIYWEDDHGSTALHILCSSRHNMTTTTKTSFYETIYEIIEIDPTLIAKPKHSTSWTPIHIFLEIRFLSSTSRGWTTTVEEDEHLLLHMIQVYPSAVSIRLQKAYHSKTPFHIACQANVNLPILKAVLLVDPSLALQTCSRPDGRDETPMELLWTREEPTERENVDRRNIWLTKLLQKMALVLQAAYCGEIVDIDDDDVDDNDGTTPEQGKRRTFHLLCAMSSIRCPRDYVSRVLSIERKQISIPDSRMGWLPLHYAILSAQEEDTTAYSSFLIGQLLEEYPEAAMIPFRPGGTLLPLHVLIADRAMTWHNGGVQQLAMASHASVLIQADPRTRLVPAFESAIHAIKSRQHLTTTFELLRLAPQVLQDNFFS